MAILACAVFVCLYASSQAYQYDLNNVHQMEITDGHRRLGQYRFQSCNKNAPINFTMLNITPDPIVLSNISLEAEVNISAEIKGDISYKGDLQMKIGQDFQSLCDLIQPYCEGKDVCDQLKKVPKALCVFVQPPLKNGCHCPFEKGLYKLPNMKLPIPDIPYVIEGEFKLHFELFQGSQQLTCIDLDFCLNSCE